MRNFLDLHGKFQPMHSMYNIAKYTHWICKLLEKCKLNIHVEKKSYAK
jgi:hypothetical protein